MAVWWPVFVSAAVVGLGTAGLLLTYAARLLFLPRLAETYTWIDPLSRRNRSKSADMGPMKAGPPGVHSDSPFRKRSPSTSDVIFV